MKTFIATMLVALALSGATIAATAPDQNPPGPADRDSSATRTNYAMAEDGIVRKVMSNFCVTWARDAYCAKN